ncbi:MAG: CHAD domain-containing protein, partial [Burkholderiales bacterium]|nr:CHAD domain-containing protein [Burkholderiales bacterium]
QGRVLTVKSTGTDALGHARGEWEWPVPRAALDFDLLAETPLADWFAKPRNREALAPAFETRFTRSSALIQCGGSAIELAIDRGNVIAGERREPILELELELKDGPVDGLFEFALSLNRDHALMPEPRSKAARGFMLSTGAKPAPVRAPKLQIDADATAEQAFVSVMLNCLAHLQGNAAAVHRGDDDPEYVHQARVALRRMRSTLVTFRRAIPRSASDSLSSEARALATALGAARDLDVFEEGTLAPLAEAGHATRLAGAFERLAVLRAQAQRQAADALSPPGYTAFVLHLLRWIDGAGWRTLRAGDPPSAGSADGVRDNDRDDGGANDGDGRTGSDSRDGLSAERPEVRRQKAGIRRFAAGTLDRRHRAVIAIGGRPSGLDIEARHELRIAVKKLRYAAESFATLGGGKAEKAAGSYLAAISRLQQSLGILNDMATAERLVSPGPAGAFEGAIDEAGLALLAGWRLGLCSAGLEDADQAWIRFREAGRFW